MIFRDHENARARASLFMHFMALHSTQLEELPDV